MLIVIKNACVSEGVYCKIMLMVKHIITIVSFVGVIFLLLSQPVIAADTQIVTPAQESILITEIQANGEGTGTTTQELIELFNPLAEPVNLLDWSVVYVNSSGTQTVLYTFSEPLLFLPNTFIIGKNTATATTYLPDITPDFTYMNGSSGLAATSGGVIIKDSTQLVVDEVYWTSSATFVNDKTINSLSNGKSVQRECDSSQKLVDSNLNSNDFMVALPTPASFTCDPPIVDEEDPEEEIETPPVDIPEDETPTPIERVRLPLVINELFVDPASPLTDSSDEYIEIYNPNSVPMDVSGYSLIAGTTTKYSYTFPYGSSIPAYSYSSISSSNTSIALSNSGGTVELQDDTDATVDIVTYEKAISGAAWAFTEAGTWLWTTSPTKDAKNIITIPKAPAVTAAKKKTATSTKKAKSSSTKKTNYSVALPIQINEVYPDPKSPETDAKDEFIELYNPHPYTINVTDYTIIAGTTKKYKYILPQGSMLPANSYMVITSEDTNISLTNNDGSVQLLNNFDKEIDVVSYEAAKTGVSYARDDMGKWQWTTTVTKGEQNIITNAVTNKKDTIVAGVVAGTDGAPLAPAPQPLPGWVLAILGVSAVCYAAYEYRFEVRNRIYKFQANRTAR
jgi:hypothetical protein